MKKMRLWKLKRGWLRFYQKTTLGKVLEKTIYDRIPNRAAGLSFTSLLPVRSPFSNRLMNSLKTAGGWVPGEYWSP